MSVLVEGISVIVRLETLKTKYPGGPMRYWLNCPNKTFCADGTLARIGFMAPCDVRVWIDILEEHGFIAVDKRDHFVDLAVVDQLEGPTRSCDWLESGVHKDGYALAWLKGTEPARAHFPRNWKLETSLSMHFQRTSKDLQQGWLDEACPTPDGMHHRKNPLTGQLEHLAMIWGPQEDSQVS